MMTLTQPVNAQYPLVAEVLDQLDDLVFAAIGGSVPALAELEALWPQVIDRLGHAVVAESREHYLQRALAIWQECLEGDVQRAVTTLDVLCVLFAE